MGIFGRLFNWLRSFFVKTTTLQQAQTTEEVFRSVIASKSKQYSDLKHKTMYIKSLRDERKRELEQLTEEVRLINQELDYALSHGDDEAGLELLEIQDEKVAHLQQQQSKTDELNKQTEVAMRAVESFQTELRNLRRELEHMRTVEASVALQSLVQECSTMSMDEDMRALESVREECARRKAMAEVNRNEQVNSFEAKRAQLQSQISSDQNKKRLAALSRRQQGRIAH